MRIACLVTVCAALTSTLCSTTVSAQNGYEVKEYRMASESRNASLAADSSHNPDDFPFLRDMPSRRQRRSYHPQIFPIRQFSSRSSSRTRPRRQLRKLSIRSLPISRSLDITQSQNQIESIQAPETFEDGTIHIEPLYRVTKKKGIWDSLIDILHRVVDPPKSNLGPLIGPLHVPGMGDKVYIRLLEPPESNHLVIKVVSHLPSHEIEAPPHLPSITTVAKNQESIPVEHHSSFSTDHSSLQSADIFSGSGGHLPQLHSSAVEFSSDQSISSHHPGHSDSHLSDVFSSPSTQHQQVHQQVHHHSPPSADNLASSSNQYQQVHHPPGSQHSDKPPSVPSQYRHSRPPGQKVHGPSKNVMKIPKTTPTTYKPPKDRIRNSRMFKMKHNHREQRPPSPTSQTPTTTVSPTKPPSVQQSVRIESHRQSPSPSPATSISSSNDPRNPGKENREPFFHSFQFEDAPFRSEQYHYRPTPTVELHEFGNNDVFRPKSTQPTISLNPLYAEVPSSPLTRVGRVIPVENSTPKSHIGTGEAFEMVRAPNLIPTYPPFVPHPPFIPQYESPMINTSPMKFSLFTPMEAAQPSWQEKPAKSKEVRPITSPPNVSSSISGSRNSNNSWESTKMKHVDRPRPEKKTNKVLLADAPATSHTLKSIDSFVTLTNPPPSLPPTIKTPTVPPLGRPVNNAPLQPTSISFSKGPTIVPLNNVITSNPSMIPLNNTTSKGPTVIPVSEPVTPKKSQRKDEGKKQKEKKVGTIVEHRVETVVQESGPPVTTGNTIPAAKVSKPSSNGARAVSSTAKPVPVSSTTKKPSLKRPMSNGGGLPHKSMVNTGLKKTIVGNTTRKPPTANTTRKPPSANTTRKPPSATTTQKSLSGSTTKKPLMQASDFKKRLELWKKNGKV